MSDEEADIEYHEGIESTFPKEYVEAVVGDARKIAPNFADRMDTLVVVNQRRLAIVIDKPAQRTGAVPVEAIEALLDGTPKEKLQTWLAGPSTLYYILHLPGSWFESKS